VCRQAETVTHTFFVLLYQSKDIFENAINIVSIQFSILLRYFV